MTERPGLIQTPRDAVRWLGFMLLGALMTGTVIGLLVFAVTAPWSAP